MPTPRHATGRHARRTRRRPRWVVVVAPVVSLGLAGAAMVALPDGAPTTLGTVGPVGPEPDVDVEQLRSDAADDPARSQRRQPTTTATPTRSPTPTRTGFPPVDDCEATVPGAAVGNGELDDQYLCDIGNGQALRPDAAAAMVALDAHYAEQADVTPGTLIGCVTDSYRSYEQQVELSVTKPGLAAEPGTSNHGWGLAVDVGCGAESFTGTLHDWLDDEAADFGWRNPSWAQPDGTRPEPWHWEYEPGLLG